MKILDDKHLLLPDVRGNKLFQSYQNIEHNPHVGLVFFIPGIERTTRVNGSATIVNEADLKERGVTGLEIFDADEVALLLQGLLIEVQEALPALSSGLELLPVVGHGDHSAKQRGFPGRSMTSPMRWVCQLAILYCGLVATAAAAVNPWTVTTEPITEVQSFPGNTATVWGYHQSIIVNTGDLAWC